MYVIEDIELAASYFGDECYSYRLDSYGEDLTELMGNAKIVGIDGDCVECFSNYINEYDDDVYFYIEKVIRSEMSKR